jgi:hypothetical protein
MDVLKPMLQLFFFMDQKLAFSSLNQLLALKHWELAELMVFAQI